jgi:hypothetical protein
MWKCHPILLTISAGLWTCHPISLAIVTGLLIWVILFLFQYLDERKLLNTPGLVIALTPSKKDWKGAEKIPLEIHDFDPRLEHYLKVAEIVIGLASASLVFIPTLHSSKINCWFAFALVLLGFTVVDGLAFMSTMTYFYEMFLFNPTSFSAGRSSLMFSLGFSGFACFALAYLVIAVVMALAYTHGDLSVVH